MERQVQSDFLELKDIEIVFPFLTKNIVVDLIREGKFPKGKKILTITIWSVASIEHWLEERT